MLTLSDFTTGGNFPPKTETARFNRIAQNRRLYNNNLSAYITNDQDVNSEVNLNLFRKAVNIYTNFLLSRGVEIDFGSEEANSEFEPILDHLLDVLYLVNTDSKRYGVGLVTLDQRSGLFRVYEPDQWYQIHDTKGNLQAEILVDYSNNQVEVPKNSQRDPNSFTVISITTHNYVSKKKSIQSYELRGGQIGNKIGAVEEYTIEGRQIAPLYSGYSRGQEGTSMFDDIKDVVIDMVKIKRSLSRSIEKNSRPHLAAPAGILVENDDGQVAINTEGMLFPLNQGDEKPFYLQWDTNADAAKFQIEEHWNSYFALTDIPRVVFENSTGQATSGEALRRLLFPFLSSLSRLRKANITLVKMLIAMYDNYLLTVGGKRLPTVSPTIEFDYDSIFEDSNEPQA